MSTYAERADVEAIFGTHNVETWAKLSDDDDASAITARITALLEWATEEMNERLRKSRYKVPLVQSGEATQSASAVRCCAQLTGVALYEARGIDDTEEGEGGNHALMSHRKQAERWMREVLAGQRELDQDLLDSTQTTAPQVHAEEPDTEESWDLHDLDWD